MKTSNNISSKHLSPMTTISKGETIDFEKVLFEKFKPGKFLMSIQSPSVSQAGVSRSQTSHSIKKLVTPKLAEPRPPQRFIYTQHAQQENKLDGKLPELETKTPLADIEAKNTGFATEQKVERQNSPYSVEFQLEKPESRQFNSDGFDKSNGMMGFHRSLLQSRENEIEKLQKRIAELQKEAHKGSYNKSLKDFDWETQDLDFLDSEDVRTIKHMLSDVVMKMQMTYNRMRQRENKFSNLIDSMEKAIVSISEHEFRRMKENMESLRKEFDHVSGLETEFGIKSRELEKKNLEFAKLKNKLTRQTERCELLEKELGDYKRTRSEQEETISSLKKHLEAEKTKSKDSEKKVEVLEKRIELILECDIALDKDGLRKALTELVKENEGLKRESFLKNKEIKKLKDDSMKAGSKINRLNKKIDNLSKSKKGLGAPEKGLEDQDKTLFNVITTQDDPLNLLKSYVVPMTLDFRTNSLRMHFAELLSEIMDQGSHVFLSQLNSLENIRDKREAISFLTSQLVSTKEFSDKQHHMGRAMLDIAKITDLKELMVYLNKTVKHIFSSEHMYLWVADGITGVYYTIDAQRQEIRCLPTGGVFRDVVENARPLNKRNMKNTYICELTLSNEKHSAESTLIFPIKNSRNNVYAVLEISNIVDGHYGFDEEYFGILLSHLCSHSLQRILEETTRIQEIKIKDMLFHAFLALCECNTRGQLAVEIRKWTNKLFGVSSSSFMFVEDNNFHQYDSETAPPRIFPVSMGIAGEVVKLKKAMITADMNNSKDHNILVDLKTLLPTFTVPVTTSGLHDGAEDYIYVIGVLQLALKQKSNSFKEEKTFVNDYFLNLIGIEEPLENSIRKYSEFVSTAIYLFKTREKTTTQASS